MPTSASDWRWAAAGALAMVPVTWIMVAPLLGLADEPGTSRHIERCAALPDAPACLDESGAVGS